MKREQEMLGALGKSQEILGALNDDFDTNVDIVFVIDATESMQPLIDKVKSITLSFRDDLEKALKAKKRVIRNLRTKVIVFRDYYVDDKYAMEESRFFYLPDEKNDFYNFVSKIRAGGGGDEPESGLEALSLALRSDFVRDGEKKRHIIALFTDAPAHELEQQKDGVPACYPDDMFGSLSDIFSMWGKQDFLGGTSSGGRHIMDPSARRLVLFAPDVYPWNDIANELDNVIRKKIDKGNGGRDLVLDDVMAMLAESI